MWWISVSETFQKPAFPTILSPSRSLIQPLTQSIHEILIQIDWIFWSLKYLAYWHYKAAHKLFWTHTFQFRSAYLPSLLSFISLTIDPPIGIFEYCQSWCGNRTHFFPFYLIFFLSLPLTLSLSFSLSRSFSCILESNKETWFKLKCKLSDTT